MCDLRRAPVSFDIGIMSFGRSQDAGRTMGAPDVLLWTSQTPIRLGAPILVADNGKWPGAPELREFEQMADMIISAGYNNFAELADTPTAERAQ